MPVQSGTAFLNNASTTAPGYRLYFMRDSQTTIVLLCGGDKDSQQRDIARAKQIADEWREANA